MIRVPLALLAAAIPGAELTGRRDAVLRRLVTDSKEVRRGDAFACIRGQHADGHAFVAEAMRRGAAALIADRPLAGADAAQCGILMVPDVAVTLAQLAPAFYGEPTRRLQLIGVTGTSGKTTTTHLIRAILEAADGRRGLTGLIGTIGHEFAGQRVVSRNTTPPVWDLQRLFAEMADAGCGSAVMEVSSHALVLGRVEGCEFDVAVFTNLTPEHLDFHGTLDDYAAAKQRLFAQLARPGAKPGVKTAVVNADDPQGARMAQAAAPARVLTYGLDQSAEVTADNIRLTAQGSRFRLSSPYGSGEIRLGLPGRYNVSNALAAAAAAMAAGVPFAAVRRGLESVPQVPGRMERIEAGQPFTVLVDYAHKPDALEQTLQAVRLFTAKKVLAVFGCGGERDQSKRAPMGRLAARLADETVITSDNPRSEDPDRIIAEIAAGCRSENRECRVEADRGLAIRLALSLARRGDTVLIAGKGHETYQIFRDRTVHFDDRETARRELARLGYRHGKLKTAGGKRGRKRKK